MRCERCRFLLAEYEKRALVFSVSVRLLADTRGELPIPEFSRMVLDTEENRVNAELAHLSLKEHLKSHTGSIDPVGALKRT